MSDFQNQLDKEVEKRTQEGEIEEEISSPSPQRSASKISLSAFAKAMLIGLLFFFGIAVWAGLKKDETQKNIQARLASKTAIVERNDSEVYRLSEVQSVLQIPPVNLEDAFEQQQAAQAADPQEPVIASSPNEEEALVRAPIPGLYESVSQGLLPAIRQNDGLKPFEAYKRPFQPETDKPLLSIVVVDMGLSRKMTEGLIQNLPPEISLTFSPYAKNLKLLTEVARGQGHETWLTLPLETRNYPFDDPGPSTILVNASVEQNKSRLTSLLGSAHGYVGFVTQKDHVFSREDAAINPSIEEIFSRGLAVVDANTSSRNFLTPIAFKNDYPNTKNNFWLDDNNLTPIAFNQQIRQAIEYGKASGGVIMMLRPYPASVKALQKFLNSAAADNFQLAPLSAQVVYGES